MPPKQHVAGGTRTQSRNEVVELIPALRAFARTFYHDPYDADDLVQETLTKGLAKIDQFHPGTSLKSWLFTIMRNTFCTRIKLLNREAPAATDCASTRPVADPTQEWSVRGQEIRNAVARLPEDQREVLILIGVLGASYEETAEICECAMGTVKSRLHRARSRLLIELGEASSQSSVARSERDPAASIAAAAS